MRIHTGEEECM